jgi:hypothetical protein
MEFVSKGGVVFHGVHRSFLWYTEVGFVVFGHVCMQASMQTAARHAPRCVLEDKSAPRAHQHTHLRLSEDLLWLLVDVLDVEQHLLVTPLLRKCCAAVADMSPASCSDRGESEPICVSHCNADTLRTARASCVDSSRVWLRPTHAQHTGTGRQHRIPVPVHYNTEYAYIRPRSTGNSAAWRNPSRLGVIHLVGIIHERGPVHPRARPVLRQSPSA